MTLEGRGMESRPAFLALVVINVGADCVNRRAKTCFIFSSLSDVWEERKFLCFTVTVVNIGVSK
jgi:hypothetical protein